MPRVPGYVRTGGKTRVQCHRYERRDVVSAPVAHGPPPAAGHTGAGGLPPNSASLFTRPRDVCRFDARHEHLVDAVPIHVEHLEAQPIEVEPVADTRHRPRRAMTRPPSVW